MLRMPRSFAVISTVALALILAGCPDNDSDSGAPGSDSAMLGSDSAMIGTDSAAMGTDSAMIGSDSGTMASQDCMDWCSCYVATCFGDDTYLFATADEKECLTACALLNPTVVDLVCRAQHCGLAMMGMSDAHCDHSAGVAICN